MYAYRDGGAAAVGLVGLVRFLPSAVASPFASVLGDRYRRERVIVVAELVRALLLAATTAVVVLDGSPGCRLRPGRPGRHRVLGRSSGPGGLLPTVAKTPKERTAANVTSSTIESLGDLRRTRDRRRAPGCDQRAGGLRGHRRGFPARGGAGQPRPGGDSARAPRAARRRLAEFTAGFVTIFREPGLRVLVTLLAAQTFVAGALSVLIVVTALQLLDLGEDGVGFLPARRWGLVG